MASALDRLTCNLPKDSFRNISRYYEGEKLELLFRKGVFPYDRCDIISKLDSTEVPPIEYFYSKLNEEHISQEDYHHAQKVWDTFQMKTMRNYLDLYLKSDVLLLAKRF